MTPRGLAVRRPELVLLALLTGCLVALSLQVRRPEGETAGERWLMDAARPFVFLVVKVRGAGEGVSSFWSTRRALLDENRALRDRVAALEEEAVRLRDAERDRLRLLELFGRYPAAGQGTQAARLVSLATDFRTALLDRGADDGLTKGGVVVGKGGLLGRIVAVGSRTARVQLLSDRTAAVGVLLPRTGRTAVAHGDTSGGVSVQYVPRIVEVAAGDTIVTSGDDAVYPRDLPVGTIEAVRRGGHPLFLDLPVALGADPHRESLVFVLPRKPLPEREVPDAERPASPPPPAPTAAPTPAPTPAPTASPAAAPTVTPTSAPTAAPTGTAPAAG